jgi:hypothetical protein
VKLFFAEQDIHPFNVSSITICKFLAKTKAIVPYFGPFNPFYAVRFYYRSPYMLWSLNCKYRGIFNAIEEFTTIDFTANGPLPAAKRMRVLPMTRHA